MASSGIQNGVRPLTTKRIRGGKKDFDRNFKRLYSSSDPASPSREAKGIEWLDKRPFQLIWGLGESWGAINEDFSFFEIDFDFSIIK